MQNMTPIDISDLERLYDTFDKGHGPDHRDSVFNFAMKLAENRARNKYLVELASKLHDIGISRGREDHEMHGFNMINEDPRFEVLGAFNRRVLANAIREHRASTGKPRSIVGKIVSDADRGAGWLTKFGPLDRSIKYGIVKYPDLSINQQIEKSKKFILEKYAPDGTGRRLYFPETDELINSGYNQIVNADIDTIKKQLGLS